MSRWSLGNLGGTANPKHARVLDHARRAFMLERGMIGYIDRVEGIEALPRVVFKGRNLFTLRCRADYGKGPHDLNVPESLLWSLIALDHFLCPYHMR